MPDTEQIPCMHRACILVERNNRKTEIKTVSAGEDTMEKQRRAGGRTQEQAAYVVSQEGLSSQV